MIKNIIRHIQTQRAGTIDTAAPPIRAAHNMGHEVLTIVADIVENHGEVLEHLATADQKREALFNAALARFEHRNPDVDSGIAENLVRRGIEAYRTRVLKPAYAMS